MPLTVGLKTSSTNNVKVCIHIIIININLTEKTLEKTLEKTRIQLSYFQYSYLYLETETSFHTSKAEHEEQTLRDVTFSKLFEYVF